MELNTDIFPALEQIPSPAFLVRDGKIIALNSGAKNRLFLSDQEVLQLLETGADEYQSLVAGQLSLILRWNDISYDTTVIREGQDTLFVLSGEYAQPELKALSLAAQHLRDPLISAILSVDQILPKLSDNENPEIQQQLMQINRSLYRLQRAIGNMADAAKCQSSAVSMELRDAIQILAEILEKASAFLVQSGKKLQYSLPNESVYTMVNADLLERSILNLVSNAAKQTKDSTIHISVSLTGKSICITVQNSCDSKLTGNLFLRYLRQPDIEDGRSGIGLGLTFVRSCAFAHSGTVLTDLSKDDCFKITMTIKIQPSSSNMLRTPVQLPYDYAGGRDRTLLELSDVLSSNIYDK